ncbi:hypothetical protein HZS_4778 [Henneguya salminicola]|nr:hypothetical protein HZS_4778 [Henneguya salminicola]
MGFRVSKMNPRRKMMGEEIQDRTKTRLLSIIPTRVLPDSIAFADCFRAILLRFVIKLLYLPPIQWKGSGIP